MVAGVAAVSAVSVGVLGVRDLVTEAAAYDVEHAVAASVPSTVPPLSRPADDAAATARAGTAARDAPPVSVAEPAVEEVRRPADPATDRAAPSSRRTSPKDRTSNPRRASERTDPRSEKRPATKRLTASALAKRLGSQTSAIPEPLPPKPQPVEIEVSSLDVQHVPVQAVGLRRDGQLEIPDETSIGWYRYGATAGETGSTVLVAHVAWNGHEGPFADLRTVEPGDTAQIRLDDGSERRYEVVERALHDKLALPDERLWRRSGPETLVMMTCGGDTTPENDRFLGNVIVYAVPVG